MNCTRLTDRKICLPPLRSIALLLLLLGGIAVSTPSSTAQKNATAFNAEGYDLLAKGEYQKASGQFLAALSRNPSYTEARLGLARCHLALEAYAEAYEIYSKILQRQSDNEEAMTGLADALSGLGKLDRALEQYNAVTQKYRENIAANYGVAHTYYLMGKNLWALRRIESIYRLNPFHYDTLLLHAQIKGDAGRYDEAETLVKKAIEANPEKDEGYVAYGRIFLQKFYSTGSDGYIDDAVEEFSRALATRSDNVSALKYMGYISILRGDYQTGESYYEKASGLNPKGNDIKYAVGYCAERSNDRDRAVAAYSGALEGNSDDDINRNALESFMVLSDYEIGYPLRTDLGDYYYALAKESFKNNLAGVGEIYLRKAVMMNPLNRPAREELRDYYQAVGFDRFFIDELKSLQKLFPGAKYREELNVAIINRRNSLYFNAGYGSEPPPRDIPGVLVLNFFPSGDMTRHPGAGGVIADAITFAGGQFGRMDMGSVSVRRSVVREKEVFTFSGIDDYVNYLSDNLTDENRSSAEYVVFGSYADRPYGLDMNVKLMNLKTGVIISDFSIFDSGRNYLTRIAYRIAKKIYESVPYRGRILEAREDGAVINLGSFDGLKKDDYLFAFYNNDVTVKGKYKLRKKILLKIDEIDTDLCRAVPARDSEKELFRANMEIYPVTMKRAVRIE